MRDSQVPMSRVVAMALWALVGLLGITAWALAIAGLWNFAFMFGLTACAVSAAAATAHIRCFALRLRALFKEANTIRRDGNGDGDSGGVTLMRR